MSAEQNKAIVMRGFDEILNQDNRGIIDETCAYYPRPFYMGTTSGVGAFKQLMSVFETVFPHHRIKVEEMTAEGDFVWVLHTHTATHTGPFMNLPPRPTGNR